MIKHFAAWEENKQDTYENEGNLGNQGNNTENTGLFPATQPGDDRVTRVTMLPKLPKRKRLGQQEFSSNINKVTQVTQVTRENKEVLQLTQSYCQKVQGWPLETQRVFVAVLDWLEARGHSLIEAEAMAWAVVRELMRRKRGPVALISDLPGEVGLAIGLGLEVFTDAGAVWRPGAES